MRIDVSHVSRPKVGELANGDRALYRVEEQRALFAVIDGLGHGPEAAQVAETAVNLLGSIPLEMSTSEVMRLLHERLSGSRGAAGTVCLLRSGVLEACAVGNVELRSADVRLPLVFSAGILGVRVAKFHVCRAPLTAKARLVLFSDGISSRTPIEDYRRLSSGAACDAIFGKHRRVEDDATVLIADVE